MEPKDEKLDFNEESLEKQIKDERETKKDSPPTITDATIEIKDIDEPMPSKKGGNKKFVKPLLVVLALIGLLFLGLLVKDAILPIEEEKEEVEIEEIIGTKVSNMATTYFINDGKAVTSGDKFATDSLHIL